MSGLMKKQSRGGVAAGRGKARGVPGFSRPPLRAKIRGVDEGTRAVVSNKAMRALLRSIATSGNDAAPPERIVKMLLDGWDEADFRAAFGWSHERFILEMSRLL